MVLVRNQSKERKLVALRMADIPVGNRLDLMLQRPLESDEVRLEEQCRPVLQRELKKKKRTTYKRQKHRSSQAGSEQNSLKIKQIRDPYTHTSPKAHSHKHVVIQAHP